MYRAKATDTGEWVYGGWHYCKFSNEHLIILPDSRFFMTELGDRYIDGFVVIDPTTLAMDTTVKDKNGNAVYGSFEVDGVMSEGSDEVWYENDQMLAKGYRAKIELDSPGCCWMIRRMDMPSGYQLSASTANTRLEIIGPACDAKENE